MSLILQAKRAAKDNGLYNGETDSLNWEPSHVIMWERVCNRFGGDFTQEPTRRYQSNSFLEFLDRYIDPEYTKANDPNVEETKPPANTGGHNMKDFIPDSQPVNTEGAANKREVQERAKAVNQNAVKLPASMIKPKAETKTTETNKDKKNESSTESKESKSDTSTKNSTGNTSGTSNKRTEKETENGNEQKASGGKSDNSVSQGNPQNPFNKTSDQSKTNSVSSVNKGDTVKVR